MSRVFHFFHPKDVEETFKRAAKWLVPGGRFFILTASPFHFANRDFSDTYNANYAKGEKWPGEIFDFKFHAGGNEPEKTTGSYLHVMDPRVLFRVASENGFIVKEIGLQEGEFDVDYTVAIFINGKNNYNPTHAQ